MTTTPARPAVFQSSDLSRHSGAVFAAADQRAVRITRRDGEPLVLMSEREAAGRRELLTIAGHLIAATTSGSGSLPERLSHAYPWMLALSREGQEACAQELVDAARASFATGEAHLAVAALTSWRETATALAAGLEAVPLEWLAEPVTVARP